MSKKPKPKRNAGSAAAPSTQRSWTRAWILAPLIAVVAVPVIWYWKSDRPAPAPTASESARLLPTNAPAAAAAEASPAFQKLKGRWLRPDGGYIVEIRGVDAAGKLDAHYSNPRPINVAKAQASQEGGLTKVFIELRDVNYPGSTYTLDYDPQDDQLKGIYFQAAMKQEFEVAFVRSK